MQGESPRIISRLLANRRSLVEVIVAAIILATAINLITGAVFELKWLSSVVAVRIATIAIIACALYFIIRFLWTPSTLYSFQGLVIYNSEKNQIHHISRYDYSRWVSVFLDACFLENQVIKKLWEKHAESKNLFRDVDSKQDKFSSPTKRSQLIAEATEYYALTKLSWHLSSHFNRQGFDSNKLQVFERNDIPDVLLSNRVLELLSKNIEDRASFSSDDPPPERSGVVTNKGKVVVAMRSDGAYYSHFSLTLPRGAQITRSEPNTIVIDTNRFKLLINIDFPGLMGNVPPKYEQHFLGLEEDSCRDYSISVNFGVSFKFASLLLPGGWDYYSWLESFMEHFDESFSKEAHFSQIGWENALTVIQYLERQKKSEKETQTDKSASNANKEDPKT